MEIKSGIRNPQQLIEAIEMAKQHGPDYDDVIYAIHKYKWYQWYQNLHIKADTPEDVQNTLIFEELKLESPEIHADVELNISFEVEKLNSDM